MPRDAVLLFLAEDRPAGHIETGELWQRAVVEVDCEPADLAEGISGNDRQVRDARQMIEVQTFEERSEICFG